MYVLANFAVPIGGKSSKHYNNTVISWHGSDEGFVFVIIQFDDWRSV